MLCGRELDAGGAGQHAHPALRQAVRGVARHRPVLVHRRDVDDPPAVALLDHLLGGELRAEEGALEVHVQHELVLVLGRVEDRRTRLDARVVDHHVEPAERLDRLVDHLLQVRDLADVGVDADRLVAERGDALLELLGRLLVRDVVDADVRTLFGEREHDRLADPRVAAGDDGGLPLQAHGPSSGSPRLNITTSRGIRPSAVAHRRAGRRARTNDRTAHRQRDDRRPREQGGQRRRRRPASVPPPNAAIPYPTW